MDTYKIDWKDVVHGSIEIEASSSSEALEKFKSISKDELYKKLQRHDLTRKAIRKPGLMEKIFNKGTQKEFKDLEDITKRPEVN